ncbi:inositol monophosphatase family protein [Phaeodactylibacter luteus]|uniref:Inositol monophosphatase n=1 Tax=Phaeodactylibacter luteus TaxID=1564516 RepID=A0A5C6S0J5_9BACT|nr:inositol monophosphatase family protein [Phaeodactylibacter luteus]TXB67917.1 hypothetical protein FRY97_03465 [Phaeodactylibacter luteus]
MLMNKERILTYMKQSARKAGALMMANLSGGYQVYTKPDRSRVTDVDLAISDMLQQTLPKALPGVALYSEESPKRTIDRGKAYLIADELDGTSYFIDYQKGFSHQAAFYDPSEGLVAGLVYHPDIEVMLYAVKGGGAYWERGGSGAERIPAPVVKARHDLCFAHPMRYRGDKYRGLYLALGGREENILRTDARRTLLMAEGKLDVNIFLSPRIPYWDLLGEKVIVEELGYSHSYLDGSPVQFGIDPPAGNKGYLICPATYKGALIKETHAHIS